MYLLTLILSVFTFVELNCENLFDCKHDSLKQDIEFTPTGQRNWTPRKYWRKIDNTARTITACGMNEKGKWNLPDMVALCEIENDSVARDLVRRSPLRSLGYEYIITQSQDVRGIDVMLLWHPGSFSLINSHALHVDLGEKERPTRDILYISGQITSGDTLHVLVVHAPSRYGGEKATRWKRLKVAERIVMALDSIRSTSDNPKIIIAGDFNDSKRSQSLTLITEKDMLNVSADAAGRNGAKGTYKYKGEWSSIDQIFISDTLMSWLIDCRIEDAPFLLEPDERYGGVRPFRTNNGYRYQGGFSDHLPLVLRLDLK